MNEWMMVGWMKLPLFPAAIHQSSADTTKTSGTLYNSNSSNNKSSYSTSVHCSLISKLSMIPLLFYKTKW